MAITEIDINTAILGGVALVQGANFLLTAVIRTNIANLRTEMYQKFVTKDDCKDTREHTGGK